MFCKLAEIRDSPDVLGCLKQHQMRLYWRTLRWQQVWNASVYFIRVKLSWDGQVKLQDLVMVPIISAAKLDWHEAWLHSFSTSSGSLVLNLVGSHVNRALKHWEKHKDLCSYSSFSLPALALFGITTLCLWGSVTGEFVGIRHDWRVGSPNHTLNLEFTPLFFSIPTAVPPLSLFQSDYYFYYYFLVWHDWSEVYLVSLCSFLLFLSILHSVWQI